MNAGHDKHAEHHAEEFLRAFWVVLALTVPVVLYSSLPAAFGIAAPAFPGSAYVGLVLGSVIYFYGGLVFIRGAWRELKARLPGMMTLIALAISAAYLYSIATVITGTGTDLFWELATLIAVMLLGHYIEMRAVQGASGALRELAKLLPETAAVLRGGTPFTVSVRELVVGDLVLIRPGSKVPADGVVIEGVSQFDESLLTGESRPVPKQRNDSVVAGSLNGDGSLKVRITQVGEGTFLSGVVRLVREAEASKSRLQLLSDRAASWLTALALIAGAITLTAWLSAGAGAGFAIERLVAVLVIACPHALGLAVPLVAAISTALAAQNGLFIKRRLALETARQVSIVLFDKTGTLTEGRFAVRDAANDVLALAAAVEAHSEHPIAYAITAEAGRRNLRVEQVTDFKRLPGVGAEARVAGRRVFVGHKGGEDVLVEADDASLGTIRLADAIRPEAHEAIATLHAMHIEVAMITGDSHEVASAVARELGISEYFARVRPEEKAEKVRLLQGQGKKVAMVGDGVNDAPALAAADLGIAIGAGTNVAVESAGIILVKDDPRDVAKVIKLSRATYRKMVQNLWWASGYNLLAFPVAGGAFASYGVILTPAVGAVFMSLSTVIVALNAMLLRRISLG